MKKKMSAKILSAFLAVVMVLCSAPLSGFVGLVASAETLSGTCGENVNWTFDTETGVLNITGTGAMENFYSSSYVPWYYNRSVVTSVNIADGVTSIGDYAFFYCESLTSITIPDGVTSIGNRAFYYCSKLTSIKIPDGVESIGNGAFENCSSLTSIEIPDSVTSIGNYVFYSCNNLKSIKMTSSVESIGNSAFEYCSSLKYVFYFGTQEDYNNISVGSDNYYFTAATVCFNQSDIATTESGFELVYGETSATLISYTGTETDVVIPSEYEGRPVTAIVRAFYNNTNITSVEIPDNVTSIGNYAFRGCSELKSVKIPDSVTSIGEGAFRGCTNLTSLEIPDSVTSIGNYAFANCSSLTTIEIPDSVMTIGDGTILRCTSLTSIEIPNSVTSIGDYAFSGCSGLTSIEIPDGVTSIGEYVFQDCTGLKSVKIPDGITGIANGLFSRCTDLESIEIPDSVVTIGEAAFIGCTSLTSIEIPDGVTSIDEYTFNGCTSLTSIKIPDGVESIGNSAFGNCSSLTSIKIPDSVATIGDNAFYNCSKLTSIEIPDGVESIGNSAFYNTQYYNNKDNWEDGILYMANHLVATDSYVVSGECVIKDGTKTIAPGAFKSCGALTSVIIPEGVTSIGAYAFYQCSGLVSAVIPVSVTNLNETFRDCISLKVVAYSGTEEDWSKLKPGYYSSLRNAMIIYNSDTINATESGFVFNEIDGSVELTAYIGAETEIDIPSEYNGKEVVAIADNAFKSVTTVVSVKIPDSVATIGDYAFYNCSKLESIEIPKGVTAIGEGTFSDCDKLSSVTLPDGLTSIEYNAFYWCKSLTSIEIPDSVTSIGNQAFYGSGLYRNWISEEENDVFYIGDFLIQASTSISGKYEIKEGTKVIADRAFYSRNMLMYVVIPDSVTHIGEYAFSYCYKLAIVKLSANVEVIADEAFYDCDKLTLVSYKNSEEAFNEIEIGEYNTSLTGALSYDSDFDGEMTENGLIYLVEDDVVNIMMYVGSETDLVIPEKIEDVPVTSISDHVFNSGIVSVEIPAGVTKINFGQDTSHLEDNLEKITVDENNTVYSSDSNGVLFNKDKTELIHYPMGKTDTTYRITDSVKKLGEYAFTGSWKLKTLEIPANVTDIELGAKIDEDGEIAGFAQPFERCVSLEKFVVDEDHPVFSSDSNGVLYNKDKTELLQYPIGKGVKDYTIPEHVAKIGDTAFAHSQKLETVIIPENVTELGIGAFYACSKLMMVRVDSDKITTIPKAAFALSYKLAGISIPDSVTLIDDMAFLGTGLMGMVFFPYTAVMYEGTEEDWGKITIVGEDNKDFFELVADFTYEYSYCEHEYTSAVTKEPTCAEAGETTYTCSLCEKTYTEAIAKLAHTPGTAVKENEKEATCTTAGSYDSVVYCTVCDGEVSRETIATSEALGHTEGEAVEENKKDATCTTAGSYDSVVYCTVCKEELSRETKSIPVTNHSFGDWEVTVEPTATEKGTKTRICSVCKTTEEGTVPATGITVTVTDAKGEVVYQIIEADDIEPVKFEGLANGEYTVTISRETYATRQYMASVTNGELSAELKLNKTGDTNGDDKVNTVDVARANSHAKSVTKLSGYELSCADVNGDGKVNTIDVAQINSHAKKVTTLW